MPDIPAHVRWRPLSKHRVKVAVWNRSDARTSSREGGPAKYNPLVYDNPRIEALERRCITHGVVVHEAPDIAICYMKLDDNEPFVGVCSGELTHYVWVEMY